MNRKRNEHEQHTKSSSLLIVLALTCLAFCAVHNLRCGAIIIIQLMLPFWVPPGRPLSSQCFRVRAAIYCPFNDKQWTNCSMALFKRSQRATGTPVNDAIYNMYIESVSYKL